MSSFQPGEIVDITIHGARVVSSAAGAMVFERGDGRFVMNTTDLTITRVAPADWPPQPGDLWECELDEEPDDPWDKKPTTWFAHHDRAQDGDRKSRIMLIPADGDLSYSETDPEKVRAFGGRWTLIRREQQDGGETP